ncbi:sugar nucleotide-binding protein [Maricaulis sp.]|uniref:sugar nucleotide-binding protein n=1 Tax=Maricaulis sp. TaxID=1486257 RepID=UPI003A9383A7
MQNERLAISGLVQLTPPRFGDHRGDFSGTYKRGALAALGLCADYSENDQARSGTAESVLATAAPGSVLVNATAYTDVNRAEAEPEQVRTINAMAPGILAESCMQAGMPLIHLSTDFSMTRPRAQPVSRPPPAIRLPTMAAPSSPPMRPCRTTSPATCPPRTTAACFAAGKNLVRTMVEVNHHRNQVQVGRIAAKEFASPAARPAFSVLDCGAIADRFGISQPDHGEALARAITLILAGGTTGDATKAC